MAEPGLQAVKALPQRLRDFFARYPPQIFSAKHTGITIPLTRQEAKEAAIARSAALERQKPSAKSAPSGTPVNEIPVPQEAASITSETIPPIPTSAAAPASKLPPNPFLPRKNFVTGRWAGAKVGLRRQAELVKLAKQYGIEELLPPGRKSTAFKEQRMLQRGLRVKGTGEGEKVKGHKWERHVGTTLEKRRVAMEKMPELIREWKQRGHGRGWKKYPK